MPVPAIEFRDVSFARPGRPRVLDHFSLSVESGDVLALVGRSGAGKTTLLKLVNRLLLPDAGDVVVEGRDTRDWEPIRLRRRVGYVLQEVGLFPHMTVEESVGVARALAIDPPVLLMYEPFGALDPLTRAELHDEFRRIQHRLRKTVIIV